MPFEKGAGGTPPDNAGKTFPAEPVTETDFDTLMRRCSYRAPTGLRNRALLAVLYRSGPRISEALSLKPADINEKDGTIRILRGKGKRARTVPIESGALALVQKWIERRDKVLRDRLGKVPRGALLFCTLDGTPMSDDHVRVTLRRLRAKEPKIEKRIHPHGFRHGFAANAHRRGLPLVHIQRILGHASLDMTARYLQSLTNEEAIEAFHDLPPRDLDSSWESQD